MTDEEPGFQVNPPSVDAAGAAAIQIGQAVSALAGGVDPASSVRSAQPGLMIGTTLPQLVPLWERHLRAVGADVQRTGRNLRGSARSYTSTESTAAQTFSDLMP